MSAAQEAEKSVLDQYVEARRGIESTYDGLKAQLQLQADQIKAAGASKKDSAFSILDVMRAVLILVNREKGQISDEAIVKATDGRLLDKILNSFDPQQILKWQNTTISMQYLGNKSWDWETFKTQSECAGHLSQWVGIVLQMKESQSSPTSANKRNVKLPFSSPSARPRTAKVSPAKKQKVAVPKGPQFYKPPPIPTHGFYDPWLLLEICDQFNEKDFKELLRFLRPSQELQNNVKLLMIALTDEKQKKTIDWKLFTEYSSGEWLRRMRNFNLLQVPAWKIYMIKGQMDQPWFDLKEQKKASMVSYLFTYWIKAVIYNWDALVNILKTEKQMSQAEIDNIRLGNHLEIINGQQALSQRLINCDVQKSLVELKALAKPPQNVADCANLVLCAFGKKLEWHEFLVMCANPRLMFEQLCGYSINRLSEAQYNQIKKDSAEITVELLFKKSRAAGDLLQWVFDLLECYEKNVQVKDSPEELQKISVQVYDEPIQVDEKPQKIPSAPDFSARDEKSKSKSVVKNASPPPKNAAVSPPPKNTAASPPQENAERRIGRQVSREKLRSMDMDNQTQLKKAKSASKLNQSVGKERNSTNQLNATAKTAPKLGQIEPVLDQNGSRKAALQQTQQTPFSSSKMSLQMTNQMTNSKKKLSKTMYGNVAKLTQQQELFAQRMDQMRKEAQLRNKVQYAKVKKANDLILADNESRQQVTYQRLYEKGTRKLLDLKGAAYFTLNQDDEEAWRTPSPSKSPGGPGGDEALSPHQQSPMNQSDTKLQTSDAQQL